MKTYTIGLAIEEGYVATANKISDIKILLESHDSANLVEKEA